MYDCAPFRHDVNPPRFPPTRIDNTPGPGSFDANIDFTRMSQPVRSFGHPSSTRSLRPIDSSTELCCLLVTPNSVEQTKHERRLQNRRESVFGRAPFGLFFGVPRSVDYHSMQRSVRAASSPRRILSDDSSPYGSPAASRHASPSISPRKKAGNLLKSASDLTLLTPEYQIAELREELKDGPLAIWSHRQLVKLVNRPSLRDVKMAILKEASKKMHK
eukprot:GEMP01039595.1.p1 GENE.GEMP01039595.1~~GEMP01039595.1.p1  ORF type:complete len:217 (+),score=40.44 GEMP01039595.1:220-870(+)